MPNKTKIIEQISSFVSNKFLYTRKKLSETKAKLFKKKLGINHFLSGLLNFQAKGFSNNNNSLHPLDHQEILYKASPFWSKSLLWALSGSVGFGFVFACVARIDEVVIARGDLQPLGAERPIKSLTSGVISLINVEEGDEVEKGQLLLQLDPDISRKRTQTLKNEYLLEKQRKVKENESFMAKELGIRAKLQSLTTSYELQLQIVSNFTPLVKEGGISTIEYLREKNRLQEISSEIAQVAANLSDVRSQSSSKINLIEREISNIERQLMEAEKLGFNEKLRSPVKGRVFDLIPSSPGYISTIGETLLKIVPDGNVEAKVFLTNSDIGFVSPQMKAQLRVDAYPFTQFGHISATLKSIGEEVLPADEMSPQTRFPAYLRLDSQYLERNGRRYRVRPGQSVSANLIVRDKPVISLLTDAIEKAWDALRGLKS